MIMRKLLIPCIAAMTVMAMNVQAEELTYMRTLPQYKYVRTTLLSKETYPEVCIFPEYPYMLFSDYSDVEPVFLCFPGPEGASPESFSSMDASYLDEENAIQYLYMSESSNSFEEFVNRAEDEAYVLLDGSDGTAAVIDPERRCAYGMIATENFGKSAKLEIYMALDSLDSKMPLDTRISELSDAILAEVERVSSQMHYETIEPYWDYEKYAGLKLIDYDFQNLLVVDFPQFEAQFEEGTQEESLFITKLDGDQAEGMIILGDSAYTEARLSMEDYSYAAGKQEENDPEVSEITLDSGRTWIVYVSNRNNDDQITAWYASCPLGYQNDYGDDVYFNIYLSGSNMTWADENDITAYLNKFDTFSVISPEEDPYVPAEEDAEAVTEGTEELTEAAGEEAGAAEGTWICEECGNENDGNFCSNCGTPRP